MVSLFQSGFSKLKNKLNPYLYNEQISPFLEIVEQKVHLERSILGLGIFLFALYLFDRSFFSFRFAWYSC